MAIGGTWGRVVAGILAAGFLSAQGPAPARAGDPAAPVVDEIAGEVTALEAQVRSHVEKKAEDALAQDLKDVQKLLPKVSDPKLHARVTTLLGTILAAADGESLRRQGIKALGEAADPATAKYLKPFLVQPNPKEAPPLLPDAIEAAGKIKSDDFVGPLLSIVEKSKRFDIGAQAIKALGNFGTSKRMREKILSSLIGTVRKDVPGIGYDPEKGDPTQRQKRVRTGEEATGRWDTLSAALVPALNQLTGQNGATPQDWFDLYDRYKNKLGELFAVAAR